jgi:hypothetical protein
MVNFLSRLALVASIATSAVNAVPVAGGPFDVLDDLRMFSTSFTNLMLTP